MKKLIFLILAVAISHTSSFSQGCLPEGITFNYQSQIDSFQIIYPGCTEIEGNVYITTYSDEITNLNGLSVLTSIGGDFLIEYNSALTSLAGLENLDSIGGNLSIRSNYTLTSLAGLESLTSIGGGLDIYNIAALTSLTGLENVTYIGDYLHIAFNDSLSSLTGLEGLTSLPGYLSLRRNSNLTSLKGLDNLVSIGGYLKIYKNYILPNLTGLDSLTSIGGDLDIISNDALTSLTGLDNLTTIGGGLTIGCALSSGPQSMNRNLALTSLTGLNSLTSIGGSLSIYGNNSLTSLTGLENLISIGGALGIGLLTWYGIIGNPVLTSLSGLENIAAGTINSLTIIGNYALSICDVLSICNYLADPNGSVNIYSNAPGCNNTSEVASGCGITLQCLPFGNYYILSQADVDNFQATYPDCADLEGNVQISGVDIANLDGLSSINSIGQHLTIDGDSLLTDLTGLDSLNSIGGNLSIYDNDVLTNLTGLEGLNSIGGNLSIYGNNLLTNLTGLEGLYFLGGELEIGIWYNNDYIGNPVLTDIMGLTNIDSDSIEFLQIVANHLLSQCAITSICKYLARPYGWAEIYDNAPGCNGDSEVEAACQEGIEDITTYQELTIYPNPSPGQFNFEFSLLQQSRLNLVVFNSLGQVVATLADGTLAPGPHQLNWNAELLPTGIYYCRLSSGDQVTAMKIIKLN
jgi:hypothetical protein